MTPDDPFHGSISCLITCYNESRFISAAVRSALVQSCPDAIAEIIVVNDGSTDDSAQILDAIAREHGKVRVFHVPNGGLSAARNFGLKKIRTPFVAILDGDDIWHPRKIEVQLDAMIRSPAGVGLWYSNFYEFVSEPSESALTIARAYRDTDPDTLARYFVLDAPIIPSTAILRMSAVEKVGGFDEQIKLFEDMDFYLGLAAAGYRFQHTGGTLLYKRTHPGSLSRKTDRWEAAIGLIGMRWANRRPELRALLPRRNSYRWAKIAQQYFLSGEDAKGWDYLRRAITANPRNGRAWAYGFFALFPYSMRLRALAATKRRRIELLGHGEP